MSTWLKSFLDDEHSSNARLVPQVDSSNGARSSPSASTTAAAIASSTAEAVNAAVDDDDIFLMDENLADNGTDKNSQESRPPPPEVSDFCTKNSQRSAEELYQHCSVKQRRRARTGSALWRAARFRLGSAFR
jgi:hypothetical protein